MSDECSSLTADGMLSKLDDLLWNHENSYLHEDKNMSYNSRDTQFHDGFARSLMTELGDKGFVFEGADDVDQEEGLKQIQLIIARRAYDLACHVVTYLDEDVAWRMGKGDTASQIVENDVPDMTELPKE